MKKILILLALVTVVYAEPVTLSRTEAFELYTALNQLAPGLSPETTLAAADNINALEPTAKAFRQAYAKLLQIQQNAEVTKSAEVLVIFREADAKFAAAAEEKKPFDLVIFAITKDEIKGTNLAPSVVATIKRLLRAANPK